MSKVRWVAMALVAGLLVASSSAQAAGSANRITVRPQLSSVDIGAGFEFVAEVNGKRVIAPDVIWSVAASDGSNLSPGTINTYGYYQTPYPAPASVTVTAALKGMPGNVATATLGISIPPIAVGPALRVDAAGKTHPISPLIYGMNGYDLDNSVAAKIKLPVDRWGGDGATRYNYLLDVTNGANDWYFETNPNDNQKFPDVSEFNRQADRDRATKTLSIGTVPLIGWTTKRVKACSYPVAKNPAQKQIEPYSKKCGNGVLPDGKEITTADPNDTSVPIDESFASGWVKYLVKRYGTAAHGGIWMYELDNEPEFWSATHKDVHPAKLTYDELTKKGLSYAAAIKAADPTALVAGPVISFFDSYFYSWADNESGWHTGPCYCYNGNPVDRMAHGNVPLLEYYLGQFKAYEVAHGTRLLDYLDLHGYYAAKDANFAPAGDTAMQEARLESTRSMWDPTFTDSGQTDPEVRDKSAKAVAVMLIPRMREWVETAYPGTKTALTEYNWGAQEHINGALAQADVLGIFGREGLDLATVWGPPDPVKQLPGLMAYELYRNYDGAGSMFGDVSVTAESGDQGKLSIYAARRTSDGALTVMVLNKTFGDLTSSLAVGRGAGGSVAKRFVYSNANLAAIVTGPDVRLTAGMGTLTFPAASVTLLVFLSSQ
jgi:hypothetical protein